MDIKLTTVEEYNSKTQELINTAFDSLKDEQIFDREDEKYIKTKIKDAFLNYLKLSCDDFFKPYNSMLSASAILRKTLEQLITIRLMNIENDYYLKFYYSRILTSESQILKYIQRLKYEINLSEELDKTEKELVSGLRKSELIDGSIQSLMDLVDEEAKLTVNHHFDKVEVLGYGYLAFLLKSKKLPFYQQELDKIQDLKNETAKMLVSEDFFRNKFNSHQISQVFTFFDDRRPWSAKATLTGLNKEYELLYDFTSSIIHFSSHSIFTEFELRSDEKLMFANYFYQYSSKILIELSDLTKNASS